jgi:uncharacterized protein
MPPVNRTLKLSVIEGRYAIAKFPRDAGIPGWANGSSFFSVTRTLDELSIVTAETSVPAELDAARGWRMFKVNGPFSFDEIGVVAALASPLARVGVAIFVISTFDTDYLLIQQEEIPVAIETLEHAGHTILNLEFLNS